MSAKPKFRTDLVVVEQVYRGEVAYIVKDPLTHKYFRFRPVEVGIMQAFDGLRTTAEVAAALVEEGVNVTARALDGFAARLSKIGLMERTLGERSVLELERLREERRKRQRRPLFKGELFRMRWQVADPDAMLERWRPHLAFFFTREFVLFTAALFLVCTAIFVVRWDAVVAQAAWLFKPSEYTVHRVLTLYLTAIATLTIHELGHGVACKHFGGKVNEMGAMLMYFEPAFYCNVNDAWTFPDRSARLWVTAAGGWIQFVVAGIGAIVWTLTNPGTLVSEIAFDAALVGGIITILANANPLIPLDGYFALSDWLEMPNLRQRAYAHAGWWFKRHVLRLEVPEPNADPGETRTLLIFGMLASAYIAMILFFVATRMHGWMVSAFGAAGGAFFLLALAMMLRQKLFGLVRLVKAAALEWRGRLKESSPLRRRVMLGAGALLVLALVPWPITVPGHFVTAPVRTYAIGSPDAGQVVEVFVDEGTEVAAGAPILRLRNPTLEREAVAAAHARDSLARRAIRARAAGDAAGAEVWAAEVRASVALASALDERLASLTLRAPAAGTVVTSHPRELAGRPALPHDTLVALATRGPVEARVRLAGAGATMVRPGQRAEVRRADGRATSGKVLTVALAADTGSGGEARVLLDEPWRAGLEGPARVTVRRSTLGGAAWWRLRELVRTDLLF